MPFASCARVAGVGIVAAIALVANGWAAEGRFAAYQGAWLADGSTCEDVFSPGRSGLTFKRPPDLFVSAFIISGDRITTPFATCRIGTVRRVGDRDNISLGCVNPVTTTQASAILAKGPDGRLERYFSATDTSGTDYRLCQK